MIRSLGLHADELEARRESHINPAEVPRKKAPKPDGEIGDSLGLELESVIQ